MCVERGGFTCGARTASGIGFSLYRSGYTVKKVGTPFPQSHTLASMQCTVCLSLFHITCILEILYLLSRLFSFKY
jgi:hypothetical protein